jgi:hypothetical protein
MPKNATTNRPAANTAAKSDGLAGPHEVGFCWEAEPIRGSIEDLLMSGKLERWLTSGRLVLVAGEVMVMPGD